MLRRMQREIGFRYVKLHDVFSDVLHVYSLRQGKPTYNFSFLDRVLDFVLSLELAPDDRAELYAGRHGKTPQSVYAALSGQ